MLCQSQPPLSWSGGADGTNGSRGNCSPGMQQIPPSCSLEEHRGRQHAAQVLSPAHTALIPPHRRRPAAAFPRCCRSSAGRPAMSRLLPQTRCCPARSRLHRPRTGQSGLWQPQGYSSLLAQRLELWLGCRKRDQCTSLLSLTR